MKPVELMPAYRAVEFFEQQNRRERAAIEAALEHLRQFPHKCSDLTEQQPSGREHFVFLRGKYAPKFWIDEWEQEVKVLQIRLRHR